MRIDTCVLRRIQLPLVEPMRTSYGVHRMKDVVIVEIRTSEGVRGVAECVAMGEPTYTEETTETAWNVIERHLLPIIQRVQAESEFDLATIIESFEVIRGNRMAKAGLEMALWDAYAAESHQPLHELLGGEQRDIEVGISLGVYDAIDELKERALLAADKGFRRIKLKVMPGRDLKQLEAVRDVLPSMPLMADANSAYAGKSVEVLREMDELDLMMIEQPLAYDDLVDHATLQASIQTPLCLDESIRSADDVRRAADIGACKVVNVKPGRVGGFAETIRLHAVAQDRGIQLWCGGMYETGIGRLHNVAICSLPGFSLPTDNGPSDRYFERDILHRGVEFARPGYLRVTPMCGVANEVDWDMLDHATIDAAAIRL